MSAFFLYKAEVYQNVREKYPDAAMGELTKIITDMWEKVDVSKKDKYKADYVKNKAKYDIEIEAYERRYGKVQRKRKGTSKRVFLGA